MNVRLVVVAPPKARKSYSVRLPIVVGRGEDAKFRMPIDSISRQHCRFSIEDGIVCVTDLGSTNGTLVAGTRIEPHAAAPVSSGSEVRIGVLVVRVEYTPAAVAAARDNDSDTVPLHAAELPELEPVSEAAAEAIPELATVAGEVPELEPAETSPKPATPAPAPPAPAARKPGRKAPAPQAPAEPERPAPSDLEPAAPAAETPLFPEAAPAPASTDFAALAGVEPAAPPAEGSFDFLAAEAAPPPAADDKLDDFFKSLS